MYKEKATYVNDQYRGNTSTKGVKAYSEKGVNKARMGVNKNTRYIMNASSESYFQFIVSASRARGAIPIRIRRSDGAIP